MTHTVFISYSTKTTTKAEKVRDFLESNGVKCWMAPRDLNNAGGQEYSELIAEAIEQCK